ncbi:cytochrome P450 [Tothia fuscella]|uniref:Cytochrome P450 n=1 Tax=Tothia fuscella TaxID=1048955 RepID=A0A9P4P264_9PEZI|nr:cytochrome P450 [Tothia fuscella]
MLSFLLKVSWSSFTVLVPGILLLLFLFYKWILPKPIPGIPHNRGATRHILGDIPDLTSRVRSTKHFWSWFSLQNKNLNSAIVQVWPRPFRKPWVIVTDFREAQDVLLRRTTEFDRSNFFGDVFTGLIPDKHISKKSSSGEFKRNRNLLRDLMTPSQTFLHQVAAPNIYLATTTMLQLWHEKVRLAQGRPFSVNKDVNNGALDAIYASMELPENPNEAVVFPTVPLPADFKAILTLTESLETSTQSPVPKLHHWLLRQTPYMWKAIARKEGLIRRHVLDTTERLASPSDTDKRIGCAMDDIISREIAEARHKGRAAVTDSRPIFDELFGFLVAGHDTTSTTMTWGLKHLADHQDVQTRLRSDLRAAFKDAVTENRRPTALEISKSSIPYLDAVIEEILRKAQTANGIARIALQDTTLLGYHIPKGTDVFFLGNGPSIQSPPLFVAEELRSQTSRTTPNKIGSWELHDIAQFKPERWLTQTAQGQEFDALAGPHLAFGLGRRGCWGKRLGYLELRLFIVLILWDFVLQEVPQEYNSYDWVDILTRQTVQCYVRLQKI